MATSSPAPIVSYGIDNSADVMATNIHLETEGSRFTLVTPIDEVDVHTRLLGRHNVSNWLAAAAVALGWGIDAEAVVNAAAEAEAPAGRMQRVRRGQPFEVIVDFAHTPQALAATLAALSPLRKGRLFIAFGMPGGRYAANRARMGEIAAQHADFFVISTDDAFHEDPAVIASEIAAGARAAGAREGADFAIELNRRAAIAMLLQRARSGDVVLLAAKGHEERQIIADRVEPWSDVGAATELLTELGYGGL
jgi:UDP-N-acetylmuramoyl-L-alanyl-D-glutamate--2,6-diaminopimelate ligase